MQGQALGEMTTINLLGTEMAGTLDMPQGILGVACPQRTFSNFILGGTSATHHCNQMHIRMVINIFPLTLQQLYETLKARSC